MSIVSIDKREFDRLQSAREPLATLIFEEFEWYRDATPNVIGVLIFDKTDKDYGWVIMGRDERKKFRAIESDNSLKADEARSGLIKKMEEIEVSGETVFPQGD